MIEIFPVVFKLKIVGKLYCLLALPMLVDKIWWVNCNKQHWEGEKIGKIKKEKNRIQWKYPNYFCLRLEIFLSVSLAHYMYRYYWQNNVIHLLTFNRFRLSLLPVSMSEDHEGYVYLFLVMVIISCVHPFY